MSILATSLVRIWTLIVKEFLTILKDPKSRMVVIVPPIIQFFIFGYAATFDVTHIGYAVLDQDRSAESRELLSRFQGSPSFRLVRTLSDDHEIASLIDSQQVKMVLRIPQTFASDLHARHPVNVQLIADGRNSNVAAIAQGYVNQIVAAYSSEWSSSDAPILAARGRTWFNANLSSRWYFVSALAAQITTIVVVLLTGLSVSREREFGTFDQLLVAPFSAGEILIGKSVPAIVLGMADGLLLSGAAILWYGVPFRGEMLALLAALFAFVLCIVGVGLFISSLSSTMQQSLLGSFVFAMPAIILSGFTTAIESMPNWLQVGTFANPLRYIVAACREVFLQGGTVVSIWPHIWPMLIIAALTLTMATWLFRHRAE